MEERLHGGHLEDVFHFTSNWNMNDPLSEGNNNRKNGGGGGGGRSWFVLETNTLCMP